jgi:ribosomal protein S18 acetylase RimI-like enzyme
MPEPCGRAWSVQGRFVNRQVAGVIRVSVPFRDPMGRIGDFHPSGSARQQQTSRRSTGSPREGPEGDSRLAGGGRLGQTSGDPRRHPAQRSKTRAGRSEADGPEPGHLIAEARSEETEAGRALGRRRTEPPAPGESAEVREGAPALGCQRRTRPPAEDACAAARKEVSTGTNCSARRMIGVTVLVRDADEVKIWNIALSEEYRGRGLGRAAIGAIADRCRRDGASRLTVGTSDCSLGTIAFYRKVGFRFAGVRQGYFDTYPVAVVENGIRARDMVMFQMPLTPSSMSNRDGNH